MKAIRTILEVIFFVGAGAFLGNKLMKGGLFTVKGYIQLLVILAVFCFIIAFENRKNQEHIRQVKEAGIPKDMSGRVRAPFQQRIVVIVAVVFLWILVLMDVSMVIRDFRMRTNLFVLTALGIQVVFALGMTLFVVICHDIVFKDVRYDTSGVNCRKKFHRQSILWQEFGEEKEEKGRVTYYDRNGKKLFSLRTIDEGAQEFYMVYKEKTVFR